MCKWQTYLYRDIFPFTSSINKCLMSIPVRTFPNQYFYSPTIHSKILVLCLHLTLWFIRFYFCMWCTDNSEVSFLHISSVQSLSRVRLCNPKDGRSPGFSVHHHLPELAQTHAHWCLPTISSSVIPFSSCLQSFPASGSFPMSQFFPSVGQSIGVSAPTSVFPMNIQDWFLLGCTGWISLLSKSLSRVFPNTTVQKHQCSVLSLLYGPTLTSIPDFWKNHSFD